jgi:putative transcriptional regulator
MKNNLRYWREKKRYTQSDLAALVGVQAQTIANIEHAKHKPRPRTQRKLAEILGVSVDQLFDEEERPVLAAS